VDRNEEICLAEVLEVRNWVDLKQSGEQQEDCLDAPVKLLNAAVVKRLPKRIVVEAFLNLLENLSIIKGLWKKNTTFVN
jgi:hypothetical protein